jgi:hypothetical protein
MTEFEGEIIENMPAIADSSPMPATTHGMMQVRTPYVAAMQVVKPRDMAQVERNILKQAAMLGDHAFYSWGAGKGRVEGGTIELAMMMFNTYGNLTIIAEPVQESAEAWIFTHYIVDLESGTSAPRQWRESKRSKVDGNLDPERKDAIRFSRGQSKNIRNVILNKMPRWLIEKAIEEAKRGVRGRLEQYIKNNGLAAAQQYILQQLKRYGVTEEMVLEKMGRADVKGLDIDDLIQLSADFRAIDSGQEHVATLFPMKESTPKIDLKDKLRSSLSKVQEADIIEKRDTEAEMVNSLSVSLGKAPYTWLVSDGLREYLVEGDDNKRCSCKAKNPCLHILAVAKFTA